MIITSFYRAAGWIAPGWAARKLNERAMMSQFQGLTSYKGGYWQAFGSFMKNPARWLAGSHAENAIPKQQFPLLVHSTWDVFRTSPHFRKIVRSLCAKAIGPAGMMPNSQATDTNGKPLAEFRARSKRLWHSCMKSIDYRGKCGQGGENMGGLQRLALETVMLDGDTLYNMRPIDEAEQIARGLPVPLTLHLISPLRLPEDNAGVVLPDGHSFYRGIELDHDGRRYQYWLLDYDRASGDVSALTMQARPFPAKEIFHVYGKDDDEQLRGTSWFVPALQPARNGNDFWFNLVRTSAMQACLVMSYQLGEGKTRFGKKGAPGDALNDDDGNPLIRFAPGMCIQTGKEGKVEMHSPNIQMSNYEGLLAGVARDEAAAIPGIKASTVTGDYRNSSFSSERAADNDIWPEIEVIQDWFAANFCQPIYEAIVTAAVAEGYFDGIKGFTRGKFLKDKAAYLDCSWQGPVPRSINPVDDENASKLRKRGGRSSPQRECAKNGVNLAEIIQEVKEARQMVLDAELPEVYFNSMMGFDTTELLTTEETKAAQANDGGNVVTSST